MTYSETEYDEGERNPNFAPSELMLNLEKGTRTSPSAMNFASTIDKAEETRPFAGYTNNGRRSRNRALSSFTSAGPFSKTQTPAGRDIYRPTTFSRSSAKRSTFQFAFSPISGKNSPACRNKVTPNLTPTRTILEQLRAASDTLGLRGNKTSSPPIARGSFLPQISDPSILEGHGNFDCGGCGNSIPFKQKLSHYGTCFTARSALRQRLTSDISTMQQLVSDRSPLVSLIGRHGISTKSRIARSKSCPSSMTELTSSELPPYSRTFTSQYEEQLGEPDSSDDIDEFAAHMARLPPPQYSPMDISFDTAKPAPITNRPSIPREFSSNISQRTRSHDIVPELEDMASSKSSGILQSSPPVLLPKSEPLPSPENSPSATHTAGTQTINPYASSSPWDPTSSTSSSSVPFPSFTPGTPTSRYASIRAHTQRNNPWRRPTIDNHSHYFDIHEDASSSPSPPSYDDEDGSSHHYQFELSQIEQSSLLFEPDNEDVSHLYQTEPEPLSPGHDWQAWFPLSPVQADGEVFMDLAPVPAAEPEHEPEQAPLPQIRLPAFASRARRRRNSIRLPRAGNSPTPGPRHNRPLTPVLSVASPNPNLHHGTMQPFLPAPNQIIPQFHTHRPPGTQTGDTMTTLNGRNVYQDTAGRIWSEEGRLLAIPTTTVNENTNTATAAVNEEESEANDDRDMIMGTTVDENELRVEERRQIMRLAELRGENTPNMEERRREREQMRRLAGF